MAGFSLTAVIQLLTAGIVVFSAASVMFCTQSLSPYWRSPPQS